MTNMKDIRYIYPVQPFKMGAKKGNTIGMVIPAAIVRYQSIDISTIFLARLEGKSKIILEKINEKKGMPVGKSIEASTQQASINQ
jgi:hypothetical protein